MPSFFNSLPRQTLWLALLLGLIGDQLCFGTGLTGPVVSIWLGLLVLSAVWLARHNSWCLQLLLWGSVAVLAAALRLWLALPDVDIALFLVILSAAAQILLRTADIGFRQAGVFQQVMAYLRVPGQALLGGFSILGRLEFKPVPRHPTVVAVMRGVLLASPLLLIFSLLFAGADVTFENYLTKLPALFSMNVLQHLLLMLWLGWLALGLLAASWQPRIAYPTPVIAAKLGNAETLVIMGLLAALFMLFAGLQLSHLLRDGAGIAQTTGLTIAEYARHGFFQLLFIAALALAMLFSLAGLCSNQRLFAGFAAVLLLCVLIVLASAVQRLQFYIDSFGLSIDRVEASIVMAWLAACLLLFAATLLRNRPEGFASGVITLGIAACFGFALVNPATLVARSNLERSLNPQHTLDVEYLSRLATDTVPAILEYFPQLTPTLQCQLGIELINQWLASDNSNMQHLQDWRRWNHAYYRAASLVQANSDQLLAAASRSGDAYYSNRANLAGKAPEHVTCP